MENAGIAFPEKENGEGKDRIGESAMNTAYHIFYMGYKKKMHT